MCRPYELAQSGVLYVEVESLVLNIGPPSLPSVPTSVDRPHPTKRRKFAAQYEPPPTPSRTASITTANPITSSTFISLLLIFVFCLIVICSSVALPSSTSAEN